MRTSKILFCAFLAFLVLAGSVYAKKPAKLLGMVVFDVNNVETHLTDVKVYLLEEVFGQDQPKKNGTDVLKGSRGQGALEVKVKEVSEFTVEPAGEDGCRMAVRLWNGEYTSLVVGPEDANVVFEGKSALGTFSISLRSIRKAVVRRKIGK